MRRQERCAVIRSAPARFKFVEFKPNQSIKLARNPDYWKPRRPYLDGIEFTIIKEIATRNLAFFAGKFDVTSPYGVTVPTLKDFASQAPQAICEVTATNVNRTMIINSSAPPLTALISDGQWR